MDTHRRNAVLAGVFISLGTVMGLVGMALSQPLRDGPDPLADRGSECQSGDPAA